METKPSISTLLKVFKKEFPKINKECDDNINIGGCGIFALKVYDTLKEFGYDPEILILCPFYQDPSEAVTELKNGNGPDSISWHHVLIRINEKLVDAHGIYSSLDECGYWAESAVAGCSRELLEQWLGYPNWNSTFVRDLYVPKIDKEFKKIEKFLTKKQTKNNRISIKNLLSL